MLIRITKKNLGRLIEQTLYHNREFDACLFEALLLETPNIASLAGRASKQGKVIIKYSDGGRDYVVIAGKKDGNVEVTAAAIGEQEGKWWRLQYLYSKEVSSTPLALAGALVIHRQVIPDLDVSPAAEMLIKSYFDNIMKSGKPDPALIKLDADEQRVKSGQDQQKPYLRSGYYPPSGSDSTVYKAVWAGDELVEELSSSQEKPEDEVRGDLARIAEEGFTTAYDSEQTGYAKIPEDISKRLSSFLESGDVAGLSRFIYQEYANYAGDKQKTMKKTWIPNWLKKNQDDIISVIKNIGDFEKNQQVKYLDHLLEKIVEREEGKNYSIIDLASQ